MLYPYGRVRRYPSPPPSPLESIENSRVSMKKNPFKGEQYSYKHYVVQGTEAKYEMKKCSRVGKMASSMKSLRRERGFKYRPRTREVLVMGRARR